MLTTEQAALLLWAGITVSSLILMLMVAIQVKVEADVAMVKRLNREWEEAVRQMPAPPHPAPTDGGERTT